MIITTMKSARRKLNLVYGVGVNDADYALSEMINGKKVRCIIYKKWSSMLSRCYSPKLQDRCLTYVGCSVTGEWLIFSSFREWMLNQDHEGMELDKDIKIKDNKIYSPENCLLVPRSLNNLLTDHAARRGDWPIGVYIHKPSGRFVARISLNSKDKYLGTFTTAEAASHVYQAARAAKIQQLIDDDIYPVATQYLSQHI